MEDKKSLRKHFNAIRAAITDKSAKDADITERLLAMERIEEADTVLAYAAFGSEIDTYAIVDSLLSMHKTVALPRSEPGGSMTFHIIESAADLHDGLYGISEPDITLPVPELSDKTVCIVPGLAFTEKGGRLGYGGGYYDRFLASNQHIYTIALSYDELIVDELPIMAHDLRVDSIVTEERTVLCDAE